MDTAWYYGSTRLYPTADTFIAAVAPSFADTNFASGVAAFLAYGLGMGFNLFKMEMFQKVPKPWFQTEQRWDPANGSRSYTQDLHFYEKAGKLGYKFCCDTRVRAGHLDTATDIVW